MTSLPAQAVISLLERMLTQLHQGHVPFQTKTELDICWNTFVKNRRTDLVDDLERLAADAGGTRDLARLLTPADLLKHDDIQVCEALERFPLQKSCEFARQLLLNTTRAPVIQAVFPLVRDWKLVWCLSLRNVPLEWWNADDTSPPLSHYALWGLFFSDVWQDDAEFDRDFLPRMYKCKGKQLDAFLTTRYLERMLGTYSLHAWCAIVEGARTQPILPKVWARIERWINCQNAEFATHSLEIVRHIHDSHQHAFSLPNVVRDYGLYDYHTVAKCIASRTLAYVNGGLELLRATTAPNPQHLAHVVWSTILDQGLNCHVHSRLAQLHTFLPVPSSLEHRFRRTSRRVANIRPMYMCCACREILLCPIHIYANSVAWLSCRSSPVQLCIAHLPVSWCNDLRARLPVSIKEEFFMYRSKNQGLTLDPVIHILTRANLVDMFDPILIRDLALLVAGYFFSE
jgi:hypothetical protein